jgi:hypothetical protein
MIPPQMPTGRPIRQAILDHQTHRPLLDAMCVMAIGQGQIVHFAGEAPPAGGALVLGVFDMQIQRPLTTGVAQIVQDPNGGPVSPGLGTTEGTSPPPVIPAPRLYLCRRQLLHPRNTFTRISNVISRAYHGRFSRRSASVENIGQSLRKPQGICTNDATVSILFGTRIASIDWQ